RVAVHRRLEAGGERVAEPGQGQGHRVRVRQVTAQRVPQPLGLGYTVHEDFRHDADGSCNDGAVRVLEMWRHPVKSFQGQRLEEAEIVADGLADDRAWGVLDTTTGKILTGRREPKLLLASARLDG